MLVITRKEDQSFTIGDATIIIKYAKNGTAKICIDAPKDVSVRRDDMKVGQELLSTH
ncbi:MAG: carbon storage regulator [Motiliproteus sp.]